MDQTEIVILLHGLSRTSLSLRHLARALNRAGYQVITWDYPSRHHRVAELAHRFRHWLERQELDDRRVHFVGHSLGGILFRIGLHENRGFELGRLVMIAPPNQGAGVVRRYARFPLLERLYGRPASEMAAGGHWLKTAQVPQAEIGVIAGTRRFHPLNPTSYLTLFSAGDRDHDGTVEVANTKLPGMRDFIEVEASHTFICSHPDTIRQTLHFLENGQFERNRQVVKDI